MDEAPLEGLASALAEAGPWTVLVRQTETGEKYLDLAYDASQQPVESIWFDPEQVVWGDEYQYAVPNGDVREIAKTVLYTLRDAD